MSYVDIDKAKANFLALAEEKLSKKVSRLQKKLFELLVLSFSEFLEVQDGLLKDTSNNLRASVIVDRVYKTWTEDEHLKVVEGLINDLGDISKFNSRYYAEFETGAKFNKLKGLAQGYMLKSIGVSSTGGILRNGFIDRILKDVTVKNRVSQIMENAVVNKAPYRDTLRILKNLIEDTETDGLLQRHYRTFVYDTYQRYSRIESNFYAVELGYGAAYYEGSIIQNTRNFCKKRAGKIFTRKEIADWRDEKFTGKPDNYDPFTDQGGYNCRHGYRWIPNRLAIRKRKDLTLDEKGNLIIKK